MSATILFHVLISENEVMSRIVNNHVVGVIGESSDCVCDNRAEPPITKAELAHSERDRCLQNKQAHRDRRRRRIPSHQLPNFRVRFENGASAGGMRLIEVGLVKCSRGHSGDGRRVTV